MPVYKDEERGTWYASFYYKDWQGNRKLKKKRGFKTQREAKEYERKFLNQEKRSADIYFPSLVDEYFKDMSGRLRITTMETKRNIFDQHISPYFEKLKINEITPVTVRLWQNEILKKDLSPTFQRSIHSQLSAIMNYAVKFYDLPKNPARDAGSIGKKKTDEMLIWTLDEYKAALAQEKKLAARVALEVLFWTGMREGEMLALTPADIIIEKKQKKIVISKSFAHTKDGDIENLPKTDKSNRKVTIPDFLYEELQDYIGKLYGIKKTDRIFYFKKGFIGGEIERLAELAGVKRIRTHDLRHSHVSLLIEMGYNIFVISERVGHEHPSTTMNVYGHLYPNKQESVAAGLDDIQKPKTEENI